mmetsp:Transcript_11536/g.18768  ORF Transcript_11536/g.18768 Transcript_11536/m.18768 type:complete len:437 (-) Transcript_11536:415-1725(-)|eukprot:CAMPEP_0203743840 /NCGR_PEP_ID=MMETSP0098-20131031/110_1 /ASSEMBLY_ACC=CAM_ASM_000208 /TAXON_ID=96639 /ORGANISM=" , Strain NY0313808BC1" /LENGTH=436 /DNA_ID=CAMNT_0050631179 /DNA_START=1037 /DNA_END=2347 /DNA_ORIENTATION=+
MEEHKVYKVAIVGAGPSGLVTAKALLGCGVAPEDIVMFEESDQIGGLWNRKARWEPKDQHGQPKVTSATNPIYDDLTTNLPNQIMAFSDFPFQTDMDFFPKSGAVLDYLNQYADKHDLRSMVRFNSRVKAAKKQGSQWKVTSDGTTFYSSEHLVVCSGHFRKPFIPFVEGSSNFKGRQLHCSAFKNAKQMSGETVLIVGAAVSGVDIAKKLISSSVCKQVIVSVRNMTPYYKHTLRRAKIDNIRGGLRKVDQDGTVFFHDDKESIKPTVIIYATGYRFSFPFLQSPETPVEDFVAKGGYRMEKLYKRIVYVEDPTLSFIGTPNYCISANMVFEYQAMFLASVISKKISLPSHNVMLEEVNSRKGDTSQDVLLFKCPSYCNSLAAETGFEGYWSQIFRKRLFWALKSIYARSPVRLMGFFLSCALVCAIITKKLLKK